MVLLAKDAEGVDFPVLELTVEESLAETVLLFPPLPPLPATASRPPLPPSLLPFPRSRRGRHLPRLNHPRAREESSTPQR